MASASCALRRASSEASANCCIARSSRAGVQLRSAAPTASWREKCTGGAPRRMAEFGRLALVHREPHLVQVGDMADRRRNDRRRRRAAGARLAEFGLDLSGLAGKSGIDHAVERQCGSVGHHRDNVGEFDRRPALRVERELADFAARGEAVAAEQRQQRRARVRRDRHVAAAHFLVDQALEIARAVGVAGQRGGDLGFFAQRAQRRRFLQVAGLDDDAAFVRRRGDHRLHRAGDVAAAGLHQHGAAAAEQRHRMRLLDQARRIGG